MSALGQYYRLVKFDSKPRPYFNELNRLPEGGYSADYTYYIFTCNNMKFILKSNLSYTEKITIDAGIGVIYTSRANIYMRDETSMCTKNFKLYRIYNLDEYRAEELLNRLKSARIISSEEAFTIKVTEYCDIRDKYTLNMQYRWIQFVSYYIDEDPITYPTKPTGSFTKPACRAADSF